jgi:hypothetical protein
VKNNACEKERVSGPLGRRAHGGNLRRNVSPGIAVEGLRGATLLKYCGGINCKKTESGSNNFYIRDKGYRFCSYQKRRVNPRM